MRLLFGEVTSGNPKAERAWETHVSSGAGTGRRRSWHRRRLVGSGEYRGALNELRQILFFQVPTQLDSVPFDEGTRQE